MERRSASKTFVPPFNKMSERRARYVSREEAFERKCGQRQRKRKRQLAIRGRFGGTSKRVSNGRRLNGQSNNKSRSRWFVSVLSPEATVTAGAAQRRRLHRHLHSDDGWKKSLAVIRGRPSLLRRLVWQFKNSSRSAVIPGWIGRTPVGAERVEWSCVGQRPCVDRPGGRRAAIGRVGAGEKEGEPPKT